MTFFWLWLCLTVGWMMGSGFMLWVGERSFRCRSEGWDVERGDLSSLLSKSVHRVRIVEGQRHRLARLLRAYDRCECGMERREHVPGGIALLSWRCTGFRLKTPADSLETVVEADPPRSASELVECVDENRDEPPVECGVPEVLAATGEFDDATIGRLRKSFRRTAEDLNEPLCVRNEGLR